MSLSQAVICDGCGLTVQAVRLNRGEKHMVPLGWLRLPVWGRRNGETSKLGEVEIHAPECATFALAKFFDEIVPMTEGQPKEGQ